MPCPRSQQRAVSAKAQIRTADSDGTEPNLNPDTFSALQSSIGHYEKQNTGTTLLLLQVKCLVLEKGKITNSHKAERNRKVFAVKSSSVKRLKSVQFILVCSFTVLITGSSAVRSPWTRPGCVRCVLRRGGAARCSAFTWTSLVVSYLGPAESASLTRVKRAVCGHTFGQTPVFLCIWMCGGTCRGPSQCLERPDMRRRSEL